ncbi:cupin domain-containing protein [Naasia lichenicola]|uniref:Cupin n=1 Tax=Naasia lichenicola TaxID=2565933 RepID=A0A4S4FJ32_9MICO|nr:cupin domain-containing protein [Naasia lichenicola]THG30111.1 cupin [Naasia lichenicola]
MSQRIVAVEQDGKSTTDPQVSPSRVISLQHTPGFSTSVLWATDPTVTPAVLGEDAALAVESLHPAPGGTVFMTITFPPDTVYFSESYDPARAGAEYAENAPGIAERMELDAPGFHRTDTVDYVIVLDGEVILETDLGETVLRQHDFVVQNATRHAWRNRTDRPATIAVMLIGTHS